MSITTQSPANVAGTSEPKTGNELLHELKPLLPILRAPDYPTATKASEATADMGCTLLDVVSSARATVERCDQYIKLGAAYFPDDDGLIADERDNALVTLDAFEDLHLAFTYGAPRDWYLRRRELIGVLFEALRKRDLGELTFDEMLDSLIEA